MKKFALLSLTLVILFSSCDKAAKLLFQPFESPLHFEVIINPVSTTSSQQELGSTVVNYNLDQVVKDETDGNFDGSIIGSMYLNEIAITALDGNATNNLGNFETVSLSLSTGSGTPIILGPFTVPSGTTSSVTFPVPNSPNIKSLFNGADVNFVLLGKAKAVTTQAITTRVSATIKFDK